jgi:antitoxin (DNA-binding transcriptional repressor) of toxin-antitoxin stability system
MAKANIGTVKAKFSSYVKRAKKGETIVVLDRDTPVAQLTAIPAAKDALVIVQAERPFRALQAIKIVPGKHDSLHYLLEEREQ